MMKNHYNISLPALVAVFSRCIPIENVMIVWNARKILKKTKIDIEIRLLATILFKKK